MSTAVSRRSFVSASAMTGLAAVVAASSTGPAIAHASEATGAPMAYTAGTYTASAQGRKGAVEVSVTFSDDAIEAVEVGKHHETPVIAASALTYIPAAIVDGQTLNVDAIAGCTLTSFAVLNAVADCVEQAGGDVKALESAPAAPSSTAVAAGTYQATAHGHHSDVVVEVVLGDGSIDAVSVVESGETYNLSDAAANRLPQAMVDAQSYNVDAVASATFTSRAIASAVEQCLEQAGGIEAVRGFGTRVRSPYEPGEEQVVDVDVVVVGSGYAGICAALSAQENGASVALVEKNAFWGGISQTVRGFTAMAGDDTPEAIQDFVDYGMNAWCGTLKGTMHFGNYPDPDMVRVMAENARGDMQWLADQGTNVVFSTNPYVYDVQPEYYRMDAHFEGWNEPDVVGRNFEILLDGFTSKGGQIYLETPMTQILTDESGAVCGIKAEGRGGAYQFNAKGVVLCAGSIGGSPAMIAKYAPAYAGDENVTLPSNTADGIVLAEEIGAAVYDDFQMAAGCGHTLEDDHAMIHPYQDHITPMTAVYVNPQGLRVNGEDPVKYTAGVSYINPYEPDFYWAITNGAVAGLKTSVKILDEDLSSDNAYADVLEEQLAAGNERFFKADTLADLAKQINVQPSILMYTMNRYNEFCANGVDEDFKKHAEYLVAMEEGPWYAVKCVLKYFATIGGVVTNAEAQVLNTAGEPIPGLFAAGENSNHGFFGVFYMGARATTACLVGGRIAGRNAALMA